MRPWGRGLCLVAIPQSYKKGFPYCSALARLRLRHSFAVVYWLVQLLLLEKLTIVPDRRDAAHSFRIDSGNPLPNNLKHLCYSSNTRTKGSFDAASEAGSHAKRSPSSEGPFTHLPLSKVYCDTSEQRFQMHNARGQRRLNHMTGRGVASTNEVDRRAVPEAHVAARGTVHIGLPFAKLGGNNDLSSTSTCAFLPYILTLLFLRSIVLCAQWKDFGERLGRC